MWPMSSYATLEFFCRCCRAPFMASEEATALEDQLYISEQVRQSQEEKKEKIKSDVLDVIGNKSPTRIVYRMPPATDLVDAVNRDTDASLPVRSTELATQHFYRHCKVQSQTATYLDLSQYPTLLSSMANVSIALNKALYPQNVLFVVSDLNGEAKKYRARIVAERKALMNDILQKIPTDFQKPAKYDLRMGPTRLSQTLPSSRGSLVAVTMIQMAVGARQRAWASALVSEFAKAPSPERVTFERVPTAAMAKVVFSRNVFVGSQPVKYTTNGTFEGDLLAMPPFRRSGVAWFRWIRARTVQIRLQLKRAMRQSDQATIQRLQQSHPQFVTDELLTMLRKSQLSDSKEATATANFLRTQTDLFNPAVVRRMDTAVKKNEYHRIRHLRQAFLEQINRSKWSLPRIVPARDWKSLGDLYLQNAEHVSEDAFYAIIQSATSKSLPNLPLFTKELLYLTKNMSGQEMRAQRTKLFHKHRSHVPFRTLQEYTKWFDHVFMPRLNRERINVFRELQNGVHVSQVIAKHRDHVGEPIIRKLSMRLGQSQVNPELVNSHKLNPEL